MTLQDWVVVTGVGFLFVVHRVRRVARRIVRRHLRRGLSALVAVWAWRQIRAAWEANRTRARPRPPVLRGDDIYRFCSLSRWRTVGCDPAACRWCGTRLPAQRRQFCGPQCADEALDNHVFARGRQAARRRDGYRCVKCGRSSRLEVNHKVPVLGRHGDPGCWHHLDGLETLCGGGGDSCHQAVTDGQRRAGAFRRRRAA